MGEDLWHVLRVAPGKELEVQVVLNFLTVFVPQRRVARFNRRQRVWRRYQEVLYPGYAFVKLPDPEQMRRFPCAAIVGFLRRADRTVVLLNTKHIELMQNVENELSDVATTRHPFKEKDMVQFLDNAMSDQDFEVKRVLGNEKLELEVNIFGSPKKVKVEAARLRFASAA